LVACPQEQTHSLLVGSCGSKEDIGAHRRDDAGRQARSSNSTKIMIAAKKMLAPFCGAGFDLGQAEDSRRD
jgi:hypothetical protein